MRPYQYILLDWDGNLAKTLDVWMDATRLPLKNRGIHISDNQIAMQCFGRPHEGYAELGIVDVEAATPYVLEELKNQGKRIALITSSLSENVVPTLKKYELDHFFDVLVTNEDTDHHKPHPEPLEKALELLGGGKDQAIMIGDSDKDIQAAKNAGVDSILFFPDEHKKFYTVEDMQNLKATFMIEDFREVVSIVG
jgi:HAD superfamily hydrolase (TIGR01549 family)